jgi:hypothetical protein
MDYTVLSTHQLVLAAEYTEGYEMYKYSPFYFVFKVDVYSLKMAIMLKHVGGKVMTVMYCICI